ncbi:Flp pilus assembly protein CpaB [Microvirga sp. BT688]|uniref:Flp pilus assembly protein CpaB n=1 Tax=Microvirga sp. TaxID=1873136 RepID=UPI00168231D2|nr:Flp pilus assembly protein CpaB [Microvirga sp.]MBD2745781.1 Flp pilus assembly protein CpaB [Microvirga sp.]
MNKKTAALLGITAVSASLAFIMSSAMTPEPAPAAPVAAIEAPAAPDPRDLTEILVASEDIKIGQQVRSTMLGWQTWPKTSVPPNAIQRDAQPDALSHYEKATATAMIMKGELIVDARLLRTDKSGFLATALPEGYRAFSLRLDAGGANAAGGMILPNDRVDIYVTGQAPAAGRTDVDSTILMQDIRIIAIDQTIEKSDGAHSMIGSTATLEVTPEQIVSLNKAQRNGSLSFALRPIREKTAETISTAKGPAPKARPADIQLIRFGVSSTLN